MKFGQLGAVFETCPSLILFWADAPVAGRTNAMQASAAATRMSLMAVSPCVDDLRRPDGAMLAPIPVRLSALVPCGRSAPSPASGGGDRGARARKATAHQD